MSTVLSKPFSLFRESRIELSVRQLHWALGATALCLVPWFFLIPLEFTLISFGVLAAQYLHSRGQVRPFPMWLRVIILALIGILIVARFGNLLGRAAGACLLVGMLALKATECRNTRDMRVLLTVNLFLLMAAFLFEESGFQLIYALAAAAIVFVALEAIEQKDGEQSLLFAAMGWRQVVLLVALSLPLAIVLWLFFPRLSTPMWGTPEQAARTGVSDSMSPGDANDLYVDDSPVFRVRFDGALPQRSDLYFRGPTLWFYDGTTWTSWRSMREPMLQRAFESGPDLRYQVYMEPTDRRWIFLLERPTEVSLEVLYTGDMQTFASNPLTSSISFTAAAKLEGPFHAETTISVPRRLGLQYPENFNPRIQALGSSWRSELGNDADAIVQRALRMFAEEGYSYSLAAPPLGRDRMDDFIFQTKVGYCEHYSSAFVLLMRAAGIPARVATGYLGGMFNSTGQYLTVRNSDAHAWAEVLINDQWIRIDPTSVVAPERIDLAGGAALTAQDSWFAGIAQRWDALGQFWREFVLQFNAARQARLLEPFGIEQASWRDLTAVMAGVGGVLALLVGWLLWKQRTPWHRDPRLRLWQLLKAKLKRAGVPIAIEHAPRSVLALVEQHLRAHKQQIEPLLDRFERLLFSDSNESLPALKRAIKALRLSKSGNSNTQ